MGVTLKAVITCDGCALKQLDSDPELRLWAGWAMLKSLAVRRGWTKVAQDYFCPDCQAKGYDKEAVG